MTDHDDLADDSDTDRLRTALQSQMQAMDVGPGDPDQVAATGRRKRAVVRIASAAAALAVVGGGVAAVARIADGPGAPEVVDTVPTEAPTTTPESTPTTSERTERPEPDDGDTGGGDDGPVNQAEALLRFDVGVIADVFEVDGQRWVSFDRYQVEGTGDEGPDLTEEPRYALATDLAPFVSENPRLRTYRLAPSVEVLGITDLDAACAASFEDRGVEDPWQEVDVDFLPTLVGAFFVTLTFDEDGDVVRVRDQRGC